MGLLWSNSHDIAFFIELGMLSQVVFIKHHQYNYLKLIISSQLITQRIINYPIFVRHYRQNNLLIDAVKARFTRIQIFIFEIQNCNFYQFENNQIMQRTSDKIRTHKKLNHSKKKSPSVVVKPSVIMFLRPKTQPHYDNYMTVFHLAKDTIDNILGNVHQILDKIQQHKLYLLYRGLIEKNTFFLENSVTPNVDGEVQNMSILENQPQTSVVDHVCGNQRFIEIQRQKQEDSAIKSKSKQNKSNDIQYRLKNSISSKDFVRFNRPSGYGIKKNSREGLVPLSFVQSEKDIAFYRIQSVYRQKFTKNDQANQSQSITKQIKAVISQKNGNNRQRQQFNFDYNGQKILISALASLKKNSLNILKTNYRVHKDRTEVKNYKKIQERTLYTKNKDANQNFQNLLQNSHVKLIKKSIERNFNRQGKLASIRFITDLNETG